MNRSNLTLDKLFVSEARLRKIDPAWVEALADSMAERGLMQPPICRKVDDRFEVIAGEHRFEAAKRLGWKSMDCNVVTRELTDDEARLYEIDENLFRNELSAIERDLSLAQRKLIYERLYPETRKGGDWKAKKANGQNVHLVSFSKDAARKTGLNRRTIDRSVSRVSNLAPEVIEALKTSPVGDNASEIEALSRLSQDEQIKIAGAIVRGAKTLLNARKAVGLAPDQQDPVELAYNKIDAAWARAPKASREKFLDRILPTWRKLKITINEPEPKASAADALAADDHAGDAE